MFKKVQAEQEKNLGTLKKVPKSKWSNNTIYCIKTEICARKTDKDSSNVCGYAAAEKDKDPPMWNTSICAVVS